MQIKGLFSRPAFVTNVRRSRYTKTLLVMKMTLFLLTAFLTQSSAAVFSQLISFSGRDVSMEKVFSIVEQQTGYVVFYNYSAINGAKSISVDAKNMPLDQFLNKCFAGQPFKYVLENKT